MSKILVVEDDVSVSSELKNLLVSRRMVVECVPTIQRAKDFIAVSDYDLIVLDWNLADGSGIELLTELRSRSMQIPILMLTERGNIQDKTTGFQAGTDDYLTKPFHPTEFLCRIDALLRRPPRLLNTQLEVGDLALDTLSRKVTSAGKVFYVTPKEFALLEFLMRNSNQVFSPEALLERVWQADCESTTETVVTTIYRLRKKLDASGAGTTIKNVFASGYVMESSGTAGTD